MATANAAGERGKRNCSTDTKVSEEGRAGGAPGTRAEIPLQLWHSLWPRLCPCTPWRSMVEQRSICSLWGAPHQSRWMPEGSGVPVHSRLLAGPVERCPCWSRSAGRCVSPLWSSSCTTAVHGKDSFRRSLWTTISHGRDPILEQVKSVRSPFWEEEGTSEKM